MILSSVAGTRKPGGELELETFLVFCLAGREVTQTAVAVVLAGCYLSTVTLG